MCGKAFKFLVWQVQWGIKVEWSTKNKCIVHNFIVREHESGKENITFWKIGYLYILLVENILVFHILFSDIICFVNSRIWWYEYCVFFIWILCLLHIILTSLRCISYILYIDYIYCIICTKKCCMEYVYTFVMLIWIYSDILYSIFWYSVLHILLFSIAYSNNLIFCIAYSDILIFFIAFSDLLYCIF